MSASMIGRRWCRISASGLLMGPLCVGCSRLSGMWRRRKKAMGINARPSKKGIRQPHASICSLLSASVSTMPTTPAASEAMPWLASCQLPYRPRRPWGAISIRYVVDGPTSPPRANPCTSRQTMTMMGAANPMLAYEGVSAMPIVPIVMSAMVNSMAGLRPTRSAKEPISSPPKGRVMKPTPKTATDSITVTSGSSAGKKVWPIYTAKNA